MTDADVYFEGEVAAVRDRISLAKAEKLAAERAVQRDRDERMREHRRRQKYMVSVERDEDEICLLDIEEEKLQAALAELGANGASLSIDEEALRSARVYYLAGRKVEAADVLYPAVRDALGVAV